MDRTAGGESAHIPMESTHQQPSAPDLTCRFEAAHNWAQLKGRFGYRRPGTPRISTPERHRRAAAEYVSGRARERFPATRRAAGQI
jgi:hypothetical protein